MKQYIRTNAEGIKVFDYDELDTAARANLLDDIDRWATEVEVDLSNEDASNAERVEAIDLTAALAVDNAFYFLYDDAGDQPKPDEETVNMIKERMARALAKRHEIEL